jgi:hypothetical protein
MADEAPRTHLGFHVELAHPASHADDDLVIGRYLDVEGRLLGEVVLEDRQAERFLLIVPDDVVVMHVEAALENDHRVVSADRRTVVTFAAGDPVPPGVLRDGERWDAGDTVAFAFGSTEEAEAALAAD